ncbi:MAG: TylF/MycF/NovP-related O-methyltransferase [Solirubrobacteraceae bacterium]
MRKPELLGRGLEAVTGLYNNSRFTERRLVLIPREETPLYAEDGLWTYHSHRFVVEPRYTRAYARAQAACGFDYAIRWRTHTVLWAAEQAVAVQGAFVECGTGRGWMASAICEFLQWRDRPFYLFDSFMPTYPDESGHQPSSGRIHPNYARSVDEVAANFAEWPGVRLMIGRIPEVLADTGPVAFLHIDLNNAVAEEHAVRFFWPKVVLGGAMIFDDYGFEGYEQQRESADRLAAELGFRILSLPSGQGLVIRESA